MLLIDSTNCLGGIVRKCLAINKKEVPSCENLCDLKPDATKYPPRESTYYSARNHYLLGLDTPFDLPS